MKMIFALGSTSKIKTDALRGASIQLGITGEILTANVSSSVPSQPFGAEGERGAKNRAMGALALYPTADMAVGIENFLCPTIKLVWFDLAAVCLIDKGGSVRFFYSESVKVPPEAVRAVLKDKTRDLTIGQALAIENPDWNPQDPHRHLTWRSRKFFLEQALIKSLFLMLRTRLSFGY